MGMVDISISDIYAQDEKLFPFSRNGGHFFFIFMYKPCDATCFCGKCSKCAVASDIAIHFHGSSSWLNHDLM